MLCKRECALIAVLIPMPTEATYCMAKAAQDSLTRNLATEFAAKGVRINSYQAGTCLWRKPFAPAVTHIQFQAHL